MKIYQILPELRYGDAVGNDAMAICNVITEMGYNTAIYANKVDSRLNSSKYRKTSKLPKLSNDDIIIFNHCSGSDLSYLLPTLGGRKMMIYHNITPPNFFAPYSRESYNATLEGYKQTEFIKDSIEYVMAVSEYNAADLRKMGYTCPMTIRPILIPFSDYEKAPDKSVMKKYSNDGYTNIIFVGRIAPNKKHEDVVAAFAYYKKHINPKSRLIFVGSDSGTEKYSSVLKNYISALGVEDVIFPGHISFSEILAYYKIADVFLCMSEHEGFCVPLAEAMFFDVPIIAYESSAIPDTLGGSGILLKEKDPIFTAMVIDRLMKDNELRAHIINGQRKRLESFSYENIKEIFVRDLKNYIEGSYKNN